VNRQCLVASLVPNLESTSFNMYNYTFRCYRVQYGERIHCVCFLTLLLTDTIVEIVKWEALPERMLYFDGNRRKNTKVERNVTLYYNLRLFHLHIQPEQDKLILFQTLLFYLSQSKTIRSSP
jgi:hypothetical protein